MPEPLVQRFGIEIAEFLNSIGRYCEENNISAATAEKMFNCGIAARKQFESHCMATNEASTTSRPIDQIQQWYGGAIPASVIGSAPNTANKAMQ